MKLIYLCDFVHDYLGVSTAMFPLNIGYLSIYASKYAKSSHRIKLFKYPKDFIKAVNDRMPDICGFADYTWNTELNHELARWIKSRNQYTKVVFGGPNIDTKIEQLMAFHKKYQYIDYYSISNGEQNFVSLIDDKPADSLGDINDIPSPYLTTTLNKFFDTKLIPIIETNRGCCYSCVFCCQGLKSGHRLEYFDLDRVKAEIKYIACHVKNTSLLQIADSNFGIHKRDIEIAKYIREVAKETGYPKKVNTNWAKANPKIYEIASILNDAGIVISLQSLNKNVLKAIKRVNVPIETFKNIVKEVNDRKGISGTEIILGLPKETKESHLKALKDLFDMNVSYISSYNALILKGSELQQQRLSGEFKCKTKFRLSDTCFGLYNNKYVFDTEEGIRETEIMSEDDILYFRPIHWLIQFMWNYRYYRKPLKKLQEYGVNPLDFIIEVIAYSKWYESGIIRNIFRDFFYESVHEWFDTEKELKEYYTKNFDRLKAGMYGKLNGKYIYRILLEAKQEFNGLLCGIVHTFVKGSQAEEIIKLINESTENAIDFFDIDTNRLDKDRLKTIKQLMNQYEHSNKNLMLRKMSEYMAVKDFFYK